MSCFIILQIRVSKDYEWSSRETTKQGATLLELIDLGISRLKYACNIIYALTDELKLASTAGKCQTLVAIDGFNAFFSQTSKIKNDDKKIVMPIHVSLTQAFLNITKYDWCNGAIVLTVDPIAQMVSDNHILIQPLVYVERSKTLVNGFFFLSKQ